MRPDVMPDSRDAEPSRHAASLPRSQNKGGRLVRALAIELAVIIILIAVPVLLYTWPANPTGYSIILAGGPSMRPTWDTMNVVLLHRLQPGEVPARYTMTQYRNGGIHRMVGLPGETVWVRACHVWVAPPGGTARELSEPYVSPALCSPTYTRGPYHLDNAHVFWIGDNRSRAWCYVIRRDGLTATVTRDLVSFTWLRS